MVSDQDILWTALARLAPVRDESRKVLDTDGRAGVTRAKSSDQRIQALLAVRTVVRLMIVMAGSHGDVGCRGVAVLLDDQVCRRMKVFMRRPVFDRSHDMRFLEQRCPKRAARAGERDNDVSVASARFKIAFAYPGVPRYNRPQIVRRFHPIVVEDNRRTVASVESHSSPVAGLTAISAHPPYVGLARPPSACAQILTLLFTTSKLKSQSSLRFLAVQLASLRSSNCQSLNVEADPCIEPVDPHIV